MKRNRFAAAFLAVAMAAGVLAGCAGKTETPSQPAPAQQPAKQPAPAPAKPKTLNIVNSAQTVSLDPHKVTDSISFSVLDHFYEPLFHLSEKGEIQPALALSIDSSADAKTHTIKLRKGVKFTDGEAFNAAAAKANFDKLLDKNYKAAYGFLINMIEKVEAKGDDTIVLTLKTPLAPLAAHLSHTAIAMVSPAALAKGPEFLANNVAGTGPYTLKNYVKDQTVVMAKNAGYWGEKPKLDEVTIRVVKEDGARIIEVESGSADVALKLPPTEIARVKANGKVDVTVVPTVRVVFMQLNTQKPPFNDKRVRQAANYAVDKESIVKNLLNGAGAVADSVMSPAIFGYAKQTPYNYDPAKAKALLAEAGVKPGTKIELYHPIGRYLQDAKISEAVASQLEAVGFDVTLKGMEVSPYFAANAKKLEENPMLVSMLGWSTPTLDGDYALYSLFHSKNWAPSFNRSFFKNEQVDKLLDEGRTTVDAAKRKAAYAQAQKIIWEEAPWIFMHFQTEVQAVKKGVTGFEVLPTEQMSWKSTDVK